MLQVQSYIQLSAYCHKLNQYLKFSRGSSNTQQYLINCQCRKSTQKTEADHVAATHKKLLRLLASHLHSFTVDVQDCIDRITVSNLCFHESHATTLIFPIVWLMQSSNPLTIPLHELQVPANEQREFHLLFCSISLPSAYTSLREAKSQTILIPLGYI